MMNIIFQIFTFFSLNFSKQNGREGRKDLSLFSSFLVLDKELVWVHRNFIKIMKFSMQITELKSNFYTNKKYKIDNVPRIISISGWRPLPRFKRFQKLTGGRTTLNFKVLAFSSFHNLHQTATTKMSQPNLNFLPILFNLDVFLKDERNEELSLPGLPYLLLLLNGVYKSKDSASANLSLFFFFFGHFKKKEKK